MAAARGQKRGSGGQGSRRRAGRSGGPLRQDRAWAPLRGAQLGGSEHPRDLGQASPLAGLLRYPSRMGRLVRLFEGRFGRLLLMELAPGKMLEALADPVIVLHQKDGELLFLNPGEVHAYQEPTRALVFHAAGGWLHAGFRAVFGPEDPRPFALLREPVTPRIRRLRSEEHTSELQSPYDLVCRLLLEKKNNRHCA